MITPQQEKVLALAGVFQAAQLVDDLSRTGHVEESELNTAVYSLTQLQADSTEAVFGQIRHLRLGLNSMIRYLEKNNADKTGLSYVMSILHVQKLLLKNHDMLAVIRTRIEQADHQIKHFGLTGENTIANIASIYTDTISTFNFRIKVTGNVDYLRQDRIANQVRVLLFSGIRSAVLWQQKKGSRFDFIFKRKLLIQTAHELLDR